MTSFGLVNNIISIDNLIYYHLYLLLLLLFPYTYLFIDEVNDYPDIFELILLNYPTWSDMLDDTSFIYLYDCFDAILPIDESMESIYFLFYFGAYCNNYDIDESISDGISTYSIFESISYLSYC